MMQKVMTYLMFFILAFELSSFVGGRNVWAQAEEAQENESLMSSTANDILLIGALGVGGAVVGLSTLSFYSKPSQHTSNIWTGAAVGIIAGVIWVTFDYAQRSYMGPEIDGEASKDFSTTDRQLWHASLQKKWSLDMDKSAVGGEFLSVMF